MTPQQELGLMFLPAGIFLMRFAGLWQLYVMMTESHTLNRFKDKQLVWAVSLLFFTFSLGVYWRCPNARKKGILFALLAASGITLYALGRMWLPFGR